jgi:hypothetical protein
MSILLHLCCINGHSGLVLYVPYEWRCWRSKLTEQGATQAIVCRMSIRLACIHCDSFRSISTRSTALVGELRNTKYSIYQNLLFARLSVHVLTRVATYIWRSKLMLQS